MPSEIKIIGRHIPLTGDVDVVIAKIPTPVDETVKKELMKKIKDSLDGMAKLGYSSLRIEEG